MVFDLFFHCVTVKTIYSSDVQRLSINKEGIENKQKNKNINKELKECQFWGSVFIVSFGLFMHKQILIDKNITEKIYL